MKPGRPTYESERRAATVSALLMPATRQLQWHPATLQEATARGVCRAVCAVCVCAVCSAVRVCCVVLCTWAKFDSSRARFGRACASPPELEVRLHQLIQHTPSLKC